MEKVIFLKQGTNGGLIYIATNKKNGKQYVGKTTIKFGRRIRDHIASNKNLAFGNALRKYGTDGFVFCKIPIAVSDLNVWEKYFIEKLNTLSPIGYNLTTGGDGGYALSAESREKIGLVRRGKKFGPMSEAQRKQMSESRLGPKSHFWGKRGKDTPMFGHHHTEASKLKMSENRRGTIPWNKGLVGLPVSEELIVKRRLLFGGSGNPMFGKHHSEATRAKISNTKKMKNLWKCA